jgi:hypothetical protein
MVQRLQRLRGHSENLFMKKAFLLLIVAAMFLSCNKNSRVDEYSTGIITGRDLSKCYCCWGWIIDINNSTYKFDKIPSGSSFDLTAITYPATVKIKWRNSQTRRCSEFIDVLEISY